ncbi:MAG: carboxypeptidase-like regulatory domain-containing protein [Flavobacteriales bacterium]|nr:carboxypeptidase-like regulatory domain-containing protein [Flavobacteriales bacterium]
MNLSRIVLLLVCGMAAAFTMSAQKTIVYGKVTDASTGEALPFVTLIFTGTKTGTSTDIDGQYRLETYYASDSLRAQVLGYKVMTLPVKMDREQQIDFPLEALGTDLPEVVVRPKDGPNPAIEIVKHVLKNKKINNREKLDAYEMEAYNKVEFDLNNITEKFQQRKIFKPFAFVFENVDTTQEKPYLPVFMTESLSDFYYRRDPKSEKEIIKATKVSGVENESVQQFLGDMYQNVNIYDNNIVAFEKSFVSPISAFCLAFYDYDILDSVWIDDKWCFHLQFFPRRKQELLFFGEMWVNDTTYAIKKVDATIAEGANINWIKSFKVNQEYDEVEHEVWMLVRDELLVDFNLSDKQMGVYGRKTSTYRNFVINLPRGDGFFGGISDVLVNEDAGYQSEEFWDKARHIELTDSEKQIYHMVDTLKNIPQFKTIADIITLFVSGYKVVGPVEFGPYYTFYSYNPIEGNRVRLGGRTSNAFSKRVMVEGYGAYGFLDERFKYGAGFIWMLNKNPRMAIGANAKHDMEQLGQADGAFRQDNVLSSFFRRNPANKLTDVTELSGYVEREWLYGLSNKVIFTHRVLKPAGTTYTYTRRLKSEDLLYEPVPVLITSELSLYTRFAYKEKFVYGEFERVSLGTRYPEVEVIYSIGLPGTLDGQFNYQRAMARVKDRWRFGPFGFLDLSLEAGKIFGHLPYPMLMLHQGNETYFYDESAYNLMNYFEFVSDRWASVWGTWHLEGLILNRIPLMRKLKWREVVSTKILVGGYDESNDEILSRDFNLDGKSDIYTLGKPYIEGALGVENIFKVLRCDLLYRASYLDHPGIAKLGFRAMFSVSF